MKKITKFSLITACLLSSAAFPHGSAEVQSSNSRFEKFLARYGYNSLGQKISSTQQPQTTATDKSAERTAEPAEVHQKQTEASSAQPTAKVTAQVAKIPVSSAAPSSRFERFLARYGYNSLGQKISLNQQPQATATDKSAEQTAKPVNSQSTTKTTTPAQVAKTSSIPQSAKQSPKYHVSRQVPVAIITDPHFNSDVLEKIVALKKEGYIVVVVGDFVGTVKRNNDGSYAGKFHGHDQPQRIIDILKKGKGTPGTIVGAYGNHEFYKTEFSGAIDSLEKFGKALASTGVQPTNLCLGTSGAAEYVKVGNCYFFSYVTREYSQSMTDEDKHQYENCYIHRIADKIRQVCDANTEEIFLLNHAKFDESKRITAEVVKKLQAGSGNLNFDLRKVYITASAAHDHHYNGAHEEWLKINGKRVLQMFPKPGVFYGILGIDGKRNFKQFR